MSHNRQFDFDGGASTYVGTALLAWLITLVSFGILFPYALVLRQRWMMKHAYIDGHQMAFTGSAAGLFGNWIKWLLLSVVTIGIYLLWVGPRIRKWVWQNTSFAEPSVHAVDTVPSSSSPPPPPAA